jgi:hypothetical protein
MSSHRFADLQHQEYKTPKVTPMPLCLPRVLIERSLLDHSNLTFHVHRI